ncbi:MAG: Sulfatase domain-containing protein [Oscillospiraceae bacterium]|jgi:N-sulfoglucosamine sulfohydrolase
MNIIYFHTHDTGRYIQPYGCGLPTPNLQRLAEEGTLFRQAYCTCPTCSPSRAGLLTGKMPHTNGMWGLAHRGFSLFHPEEHLASWLANHGYETTLSGIQHEGEDPHEFGYQRILGDTNYTMAVGKCERDWKDFDLGNARAAAEYLYEEHDKPFFLSLGLFNTHRVFPKVPNPKVAQYVQVPFTVCDTPENRLDMAAFIESLKTVDEAAGILLDALRKSGHEDDTLVLFTTDHGIAFPDMKCTLYDTGIGVSLIMKYKGNRMAGRTLDCLVSHLDIFPTLCELSGVPKPEGLQGVSLMPVLNGEQESVRDSIFSEVNFHVAYEPKRCIRTNRFKYIRRYSTYDKPMPSNTDESPSKALRAAVGYYQRPQPRELLFDLVCDPLERINLIGNPDFADTVKELSSQLDAWMEKTDDPLRHGVMIPPETALVNYPDSMSYTEKVYIKNFDELS